MESRKRERDDGFTRTPSRGRGRGRGRGRYGGTENGDSRPASMGRGRSMVLPAWMKNQQTNDGAAPGVANGSGSRDHFDVKDSRPEYGANQGRGTARNYEDSSTNGPNSDSSRSYNRERRGSYERPRDYGNSSYDGGANRDNKIGSSALAAALGASTGTAGSSSSSGHNSAVEPTAPPPGTRIGRWTAVLDEQTSRIYYWDPVRRISQWDIPQAPAPPPREPPRPLPSEDWVEVLDQLTGRHYYWNERTDQTTWDVPR